MRKVQFLAHLQSERQNWELLLNYVGSPRLGISGVADLWAVQDIIAHIVGQEQYLADRLAEILRGETFTPCKTQDELDTFLEDFGYPDFESPVLSLDAANDWVVNKYKNVPHQDLVAQEIHAFDAITEALQALSEKQIDDNNIFRRVAHYTYVHYREHAADIRKRFKSPLKK